jgi:hypothetical protein
MPEPQISTQQRKIVIERAQGDCEYCRSQARFSPDSFSVEHIIPRACGGTDDLDNLALACQGCNRRKYTDTEAIDPISGERVPLSHPRRNLWRDHFAWSDDFILLIGLTPIGRATIERLQLNRDGVVNLRRVLHLIDAHPR